LVVGLANHTIIISRDGAEFPIADSGAPIRSEDGSILGVVLVFRDQTEERAAQDALRASESFLNSVIEQSPYPMWISDHQGTLIKANKALRDLFQISDEEVVEKYNILNDNIVEEQGFMPLIKSVFERGDTARFELKYDTSRIKNVMLRHSTFVILEVTVFPIMDSDNKISNAVIQHMDITYRKREEQEKESLQAQLFQSQKLEALGTLVGGIAHDFNNMLQIILGYSQFLLDDKQKGEPGYKELQTIIETVKGGAELVKKLLAFGQQGQIFPVPLDLNHQISELTSLLSRTLPHSVQIDLDLTDGTTTILADHNQIDQVIMNLAINASEAMPNGGRLKIATKAVVSLDDDYCKTCHGAKSGSFVMLSVWDTGRGMDEETLAKVFDPFFSTKERGSIRGTGLGLSVVRGIVQQQGGHVTCESEPDKGTEFKVYFPAIETPVMSLKTVAPTVQSGGAETILVVDDNIPVAEFEQRVLENAGYQVILATKGKDALDIYQTRKNEISLVILDLLMPEMSGRDCLMELVNIDPAVKVLIASGYAPEDELHKEISPLVKGFVHKPFGVDELLNEVRLALDIES
jgi:PAS domain S-box-containing protein